MKSAILRPLATIVNGRLRQRSSAAREGSESADKIDTDSRAVTTKAVAAVCARLLLNRNRTAIRRIRRHLSKK